MAAVAMAVVKVAAADDRPGLFRIHHSIELSHRDRNFANAFPLWDLGIRHVVSAGEGRTPGNRHVEYPVEDLWDVYTQLLKGSSRYCWASLLGSMLTAPAARLNDLERSGMRFTVYNELL